MKGRAHKVWPLLSFQDSFYTRGDSRALIASAAASTFSFLAG
jgi:hypothetical protein